MPLRTVKEKAEESFLLIEEISNELSITIKKIISDSKKTSIVNVRLENKIKEKILFSIENLLIRNDFISGAGFYHHNDFSDNLWKMVWFYQPKYTHRPEKKCLKKVSQPLLDGQIFSWLSRISEDNKGYLYGPYVDYVYDSTYILTYIYPVHLGKQCVGVTTIDIAVGRLEQEIRHTLVNTLAPLVMTTISGRILFSNHPHHRVAELAAAHLSPQYLTSDYFTLWLINDKDGAVLPHPP
ncbi:hypothetical protein [Rosenbergiella australiborealis]|uniref:hypothetical protein n=1 Tax=Rosenbergiella australiborealis TaxID=1544696 RepID=UPI001F4D4B73|nr:hypothetical protein [Rosenbergiella australiborealis]